MAPAAHYNLRSTQPILQKVSVGQPSVGKPTTQDESKPQVVPNPVVSACAKLTDTLADQVKYGVIPSYVSATRDALKTLGCIPPGQP
jgi:hypothetical protein